MASFVSNESFDADEPIESLNQLFSAPTADDSEIDRKVKINHIVDGLLRTQQELQQHAPDTAYLFLADNLPDVWIVAKQPFNLLLELIDHPGLLRKAGGKIDLLTLLIRSLNRRVAHDAGESLVNGSGESVPTTPPGLTPELTARAKSLCQRGAYLSPRAFDALVQLYGIQLTEDELLACAQSYFVHRAYRDCAEFLRSQRIESDAFPHELLLKYLIADSQCMDVFTTYLNQSPTFLAKYAEVALNFLADYPQPGHDYSNEPKPGNNPNTAAKLIQKFGLELKSFPRIIYLKLSDIIWWLTRSNKADEFGLLLCGRDAALQRKLLKELMKSRNFADHILACSFLEEWADTQLHHNLTNQQFYNEMKQVWAKEKDTYLTPAQIFHHNLMKATELSKTIPPDPNAPLLLPPLPMSEDSSPSSSSSSVSIPLYPQLFLRPDSILFVDSLSTLAEARSHLLAPDSTTIGIDLEHLPENLDGLHIKPTLCQILQISCKTKSFLFDLQMLSLPIGNQSLGDISSPYPDSSSTSSTMDASPRVFPLLTPPSSSSPSQPSLALRDGMADLFVELFLNSDILKVGIGFAQDLRKLRHDFPDLVPFQMTMQNYCDLTVVLKLIPDPHFATRQEMKRTAAIEAKSKAAARKKAAKANGNNRNSVSSTSSSIDPTSHSSGSSIHPKKEGGLLKLVRIVLHRHLDKTEQISNWSKRPLSQTQQQYAALDAYACVLIYEEVLRRGIELETENVEPC